MCVSLSLQAAELLKAFYAFNTDFHPAGPKGSDEDGYCKAAAAAKGFMSPWLPAPKNVSASRGDRLLEDPILAMLRDAPDAETGHRLVERFATGGGW